MGIATALLGCNEQRAHVSKNINWSLYGFGHGTETASGKKISEEDCFKATAVFACIRVLSETVASLPLHFYRRKTPRGKERMTGNSLHTLLHTKPNPEMTSMSYREAMMVCLSAWGNSYNYVEYDTFTGQPTELWPLRPDRMRPKRENAEMFYHYTLPSGEERVYTRNRIMHIPALGFNGIQGFSPLAKAREAVGLALSMEEFGARFFKNDARPGLVLEHPGTLSKPAHDNLKKSWEDVHQGLENKHKIAILEEGLKVHEIGIPPEDAQFLESRRFQLNEIARIYRIPPHMIGDWERSTYSNVEQAAIDFVVHTIRPWLIKIEQTLGVYLLSEKQQKKYFFEHLVDGLLRGDIDSRYKAYSTARQWGWLSANDIREMENQNPLEKGGDIYLVPLNMMPADMVEQIPGPNNSPADNLFPGLHNFLPESRSKFPWARDRIHQAYKRLFLDAGERLVGIEINALARAIKKHFGQRNVASFQEWINSFYTDLPKKIRSIFLPVIMAYVDAIQAQALPEIGLEPGMTPELEKFARDYLSSYSNRHIRSSLGQLNALIDQTPFDDDLSEILKTRTDEWGERRPEKIATDNIARAGNAIASLIFLGSGYRIAWRIKGPQTCLYCRALDGQVISNGQHFIEAGTEHQPEGTDQPMRIFENHGHPPLHYGCDCGLSAA